ncbi:S8 family serine peptidase [Marivirga sp. S37H4]|uniref:S8 family serine peptidase n=1 Tax=Marivirga aurantiaca TaxID=2802615 RepID=A0A934WY40_9BACT|nr:S8 family serine peptidase [Marivirga aurantiaca]MBK6265012.1 S8 family serine peptidase [Marivirga aurantiaca]
MKNIAVFNIIVLGTILIPNILPAQNFNPNVLKEITEFQSKKAVERQKRVENFLLSTDEEKTIQLGNGREAILTDIVDGSPQYMSTHNLQARFTTGVEYIQSEEGLNFPLYGKDLIIGVWDGGLVLNDHQEFQSRVKNKLGSSNSNHATHVTGTIAASGVNPNAKGMVPEATIHSYYAFDNDLGPMAEEAANGLILSNHSYGLVLGWNYNSTSQSWQWFGQSDGKDNRFGSYTSNSRSIDNIAYNAPHYTIVWSAGNDRSDIGDGSRPPDGPYNIIGPAAAAKNIITVGAITGFETYDGPASAQMSNFSSWGPTNDGRIKPDLVADGVGLLSTSSSGEDAYTTLSGTSMSAPSVTGSLALLQEYYKQISDTFMTAAQLKSLAIHTTREAGSNPGPDYKFGWGVLNIIDALEVLKGQNDNDTLLIKAELNNNELHEYPIIPDTRTQVTATITWTDVPGVVTELGSNSPNVVNDLDVYLIDEVGNITYPWRLNPENRGQAAQKGDNNLDNVEKIEFIAPSVRKYKLIVSHKGNLENNSQKYALTLTYGSAGIPDELVYWVGGNGDFQAGQNFSHSSGGTPSPVVLTDLKNLVIDENSFTNNGTLTFSEDFEFENIIFSGNQEVELNLNGNSLTVNNSIRSVGDNFKISNGTLHLLSNHSNEVFLNLDGSDNLKLILAEEGIHTIESDLNINRLNILGGTYSMTGKSISTKEVVISEESDLEIIDNIIDFSGEFTNNSANLLLEDNIWVSNNGSFASTEFIELKDSIVFFGTNTLEGSFKFNDIVNHGQLNIIQQLEVDELLLTGNSSIYINNDDLLKVNTNFTISGNELKIIAGSNANTLARMEFTFRNKICIDNINFNNIEFSSGSILNVGSNGEVVNSINILQLECQELLFPDFQINSFCSNSLIQINDASDGDIVEYEWDFGNGMVYEGVNNIENPLIWFDSPGIYNVKLTISNELQTEEYIRIIEVGDNSMLEVEIIQTSQGLVATTSVENYQWFYNGKAIEGANARVLNMEKGTGIYHVAYYSTSNECETRISNPFQLIVTSNSEELNKGVKLYPNPVNNILTVENLESYENFRIFDFQGKTIMIEKLGNGQNSIQYDVSHLDSGLYFVELITNNKSIKLKFLIN